MVRQQVTVLLLYVTHRCGKCRMSAIKTSEVVQDAGAKPVWALLHPTQRHGVCNEVMV